MKGFIFYRIGTYILLLSIGFFAIAFMILFTNALSNPAGLLECFLLANYILYIYMSYRFMSRGVINQLSFRNSFKKYLRINAFGTLVLAFLIILSTGYLLSNQQLAEEMLDDFLSRSSNSSNMDVDSLITSFRTSMIIMLVYFCLTSIHVLATLRLIKRYAYLFDEQA